MDRIDDVLQRMRQPQLTDVSAGPARATGEAAHPKARTHKVQPSLPRWLPYLLVVPVAVIAFVWLRPATVEPVSVPTPTATTAAVEPWQQVMQDLSERRQAALQQMDAGALTELYEPDSTALAADLALLERLRAEGLRPGPSVLTVRSAQERWFAKHAAGDRLSLLVTDTLSAYELRDANGSVVRTVPAREPRQWRIELVQRNNQWRIAGIAEESTPRAGS